MNNAYLAGFFDGEGTIVTWKNREGRVFLRVCITQKKPEVIFAIRDFLGYGYVRRDKNGTWKWSIDSKENLLDFFARIQDHVIVKKPETELGFEFLDLILPRGSVGAHNEERRVLAARLREVKREHREL